MTGCQPRSLVMNDIDASPFPSARDEVDTVGAKAGATPQTASPSYRLAFEDTDFLLRQDLRPVRLQLELLKPELLLQEHGIRSTITVFGSARIPEPALAQAALAEAEAEAHAHPADQDRARRLAVARRMAANSRYYDEARRFAQIVTGTCLGERVCDYVVKTGGGPGIMEAANLGASEAHGRNVGLTISLPHEEGGNAYITRELSFHFHYFFMRKFWLSYMAKAVIVFPGGYGTLDELFEVLTLVQTKRMTKRMPIVLFGTEYWGEVINFDALVRHGTIKAADVDLVYRTDSVDDAYDWLVKQLAEQALGKPGGML